MHTALYISEKTTKLLYTTLAWIYNHVLVSDTHTYRFTIQTDSCNNIIKRACRYIPIWYHRTRCGFQHDVSTSQHACTHSDLPNPTQTGKARCMSSSSRSVTACPCAACRCSRGARRRGAASPSTRRSPPRKPPPPPPLLPSSADAGHQRLALADIRSNRDL